MKNLNVFSSILLILGIAWLLSECTSEKETATYTGSRTCKECHERFYKLWAPSHHGLAMQGVDSSFIVNNLTFTNPSAEIQGYLFTAEFKNNALVFEENKDDQVKNYEAIHALGGKYIYYFLTPFSNGKLQVLPLAYDIKLGEWYNTPASAVRHFVDPVEDNELDWHSFAYTFNTSCHSCHVSQLETNYDLNSDKYLTTWKEAGINCETCHGPCSEHVKVFRKLKEGEVAEDINLIVTKSFTHEQHNSSCSPCHAKMRALTSSYPPGEKFYNYFDLVTLEDPDFYPDGRDLGENYTITGWKLGGCAQSGMLDCIHCHTSSGRYRFKDENPNGACMPCHNKKVENIWSHSHHPENTEGIKCIACHMPKTTFARMNRSDHSMRPPMPASSIEFGSPNACNICHKDQDTVWANRHVLSWTSSGYQDTTIQWGRLLMDARTGEWKHLEDILMGLFENRFDEIYTTSFIRLLSSVQDEVKWPAILAQTQNPSPLVRAAAINSIGQFPTQQTKELILVASRDPYRVVRRAAASSIAAFPQGAFSPAELENLEPLMSEYEKAFLSRPDDWAAHYNLGNFYQNQQKLEEAVAAYEKSIKLFPEAVAPLINQSFAYNLLGKKELALNRLYRALEIDPTNEAANLNFGMLMGELGRLEEAEKAMRQVVEVNKGSAQAAYNLAVILATRQKMEESLEWSLKAMEWEPADPKYTYTYAYYLFSMKRPDEAKKLLNDLIVSRPAYIDGWLLLGSIYESEQNIEAAKSLYQKALKSEAISADDKSRLEQKIQEIQ